MQSLTLRFLFSGSGTLDCNCFPRLSLPIRPPSGGVDCPGRLDGEAIQTIGGRTLTCIPCHSALLSTPFIINAFVSAEIAQGILPNWRWGYGMFAILVRFTFRST
jgi:hypothetical protein